MFFAPAPNRRLYHTLRISWVGLTQRRSHTQAAATGIQRSNILFGMQRGIKTRVCDGLDFGSGAADGLGCTEGLQRSRCDWSGGLTSWNGGFSPLKQPTTPHKICVARFGCVVRAMYRWTNMHVPSRRGKKCIVPRRRKQKMYRPVPS